MKMITEHSPTPSPKTVAVNPASAGGVPAPETCRQLLAAYGTPPHVVKHCQMVARVARQLGQALNQNGWQFNLDLLESAALLHDIARAEPDHGAAGAAYVGQQGYEPLAPLIKQHMYYELNQVATALTEQDLLCLADRMVQEDQYVGIEPRMQAVLRKFADQPEAVEKITDRLNQTKILIRQIESLIGCSIDQLIKDVTA